ncbi:MAG: DUF5110 domain-containing protein [Clostridia bacterium]|nr:DUF5110 domain-containing protein [Clostridia bacterium]
MSDYFDAFRVKTEPVTDEAFTVINGSTRLSVITDRLVRVENSRNGAFCDGATQSVWFRNFSAPSFEKTVQGNKIIIKTEKAEFHYNCAAQRMDYILLDGKRISDFHTGNLKGTKRTLDQSYGEVRLGEGIMSKNGVAVLDDSKSLLIAENGEIKPRKEKETDEYFFAYGNDYRACLRDFFKLTGFAPLVPRFTLGNWWSRYKAYTQEEYITLMQRFIDERIPITVATVDMDWHWVDIKDKFYVQRQTDSKPDNFMQTFYEKVISDGWTGYSWNTDLFPDPKAFLKWLKDNNFKVPLNLHPASGVRWFEDRYKEFAEFMGYNPEEKKTIPFDITDSKYVEGYFRFLHKPLQDDGVDFWWIDWQQGNKTKIEGLDPLWALNHFHSLDIARDGDKRPLILSRFAGAGSHRYPLGFSGDTAQNWKVLDFQPYFTSTASNIGYTWWSHDIGGHHFGKKDDELYLRWVQFGVFSPIMRLHSTSNEFMGKEPWKYAKTTETLAVEALRFRHRLIPYIYTMNYLTHTEGRALCEPMYYGNPESKEAYECKNEYRFGTQLIVAPITEKICKNTLLGGTEVWLPEGRYTDIFCGRIYNGGRKLKLFRDTSSIPVLAKEGAIIPLSNRFYDNDISNPDDMEILIFRGNGKFSMYEDDGESMNYKNGASAFTDFEVSEDGNTVRFSIHKSKGDLSVIPEKRAYTLSFRDIAEADITVTSGGEAVEFEKNCDSGFVKIRLCGIAAENETQVILENTRVKTNGDKRELLIELISKFQQNNNYKAKKYTDYVNGKAGLPEVNACFREPMEEIEHLFD